MPSLWANYQDLATPKLRAILGQLSPTQRRALLGRLGKELERQLKAHFTKRDREGNDKGWPRQHFWAREVRAKTALRDYDANKASVGIDSPALRFKINGGTIKPGPGRRYLALPMREEAYGVLPRSGTIPGLVFVREKSGKAYLGTPDPSDRRFMRFYWRLVPSVHQDADPRALPPVADLQAALEKRADQEFQRIIAQEQQA